MIRSIDIFTLYRNEHNWKENGNIEKKKDRYVATR